MLEMGFVPRDDQSEFEVVVTAPEGYTLERTDQTLSELEARLWKLRGARHIFTTTGEVAGGRAVKGEGNVTRGTIYVRLEDLEERKDAVHPVRGPERGPEDPGGLPRPPGQRQRRLAVPGREPVADLPGQPLRAPTWPSSPSTPTSWSPS